MAVFPALSTAASVLKRNPVILLPAFLMIAVVELSTVAQVVSPIAGSGLTLVWFVLWPFLLAGLIGMALEGMDGSTSVGRMIEAGKEHFVSLLVATLALALLAMGLVMIFVVAALVVGIGALAGGAGPAGIAILAAFGLIGFLLLVAVWLFLQFYSVAIVADGQGAIDSFRRSAGVVRENLLSVVGYTVIFWGVSLLGQAPGMVLYFAAIDATSPEMSIQSPELFAGSVVLTLLFGTLAYAVAYTYHTTYYEAITESASPATTSDGAERL